MKKFLVIAVALAGCSTAQVKTGNTLPERQIPWTIPGTPHPAPPDTRQIGIAKLYFATDRTWTGAQEQPKWFNGEWNETGEHLTYGTCKVIIPKSTHKTGLVEKPSIFHFELSEDPERHVMTLGAKRLARAPFFDALRNEVRARDEKEIVIFIHGFNNTFDAAASRLGVLAYDMDFNGVPVLYSWCSAGGVKSYLHDEESVKLTIRPLADFLAAVAQAGRDAGAQRISVVAHSMGNRALVGALQELERQEKRKAMFDEVVMAAPDVAEKGFASMEWPYMQGSAKRLTLYASSDDKALIASKEAHNYRRIGEAGDEILVLPGLDTIDATGCDFTLLGLNHSYFGSPRVLLDLRDLIEKGLSPAERKLNERKLRDLRYWMLPVPSGQ